MAKKRVTLPKDFEALLNTEDIPTLIKIFDKCEINAYGGYGKQTALAFTNCPHELAQWLVAQGLNIEIPNTYHYTPLQYRSSYKIGNIKSLLDLGASIYVNNRNGTALHCAAKDHVVDNVKILVHHRFLELVKIDHNFSSKIMEITETKSLPFNHFDYIVNAFNNAI
jgi:ankyrin repeat protein